MFSIFYSFSFLLPSFFFPVSGHYENANALWGVTRNFWRKNVKKKKRKTKKPRVHAYNYIFCENQFSSF